MLSSLLPDKYYLYVDSPGYASEWSADVPVAQDISVQKDFVLSEGGSISGKITNTNNMPVNETFVAFIVHNSKEHPPIFDIWTDKSGRYTVPHIKSGIYDIEFIAEGYSMCFVKKIKVTEGKETSNINCQLESE